jgi:hypothetical protein
MALVAGVLIAVAVPVAACEKATPTLVANASGETRGAGAFTGEFVNGVPVYRLPAINVVGRRQAEVAKTRRDEESARSGRSRGNSAAAAPAANHNVASASHETNAIRPCIG